MCWTAEDALFGSRKGSSFSSFCYIIYVLYTTVTLTHIWCLHSHSSESVVDIRQLARVQRYVDESPVDIRQLAKFRRMYWRKYSGHSSIGQSPGSGLAKVQCTF